MRTLRPSAPASIVAVSLVMLFALSWTAGAVELILDARPGTLLMSRSADLRVLVPDTFHPEQVTVIEEAGTLNTVPTIRLGAGFDLPDWYCDITGLAGVLVNSRYTSLAYGLDGAAQYKVRKNVNVGPHLSWMAFQAPSWSGDAELDFSDSTAFVPGVEIAVGYDILFVFSIDYMFADPFDVKSKDPSVWRLDEDQVDISGLMFQFGMRGRF